MKSISREPSKDNEKLAPKISFIIFRNKRKFSFPKVGCFFGFFFYCFWGFFSVVRYNIEKQGNISEPHFLLLIYCKLSSAQRAEYSQNLNEKNNSSIIPYLSFAFLSKSTFSSDRFLHTCTPVYLHTSSLQPISVPFRPPTCFTSSSAENPAAEAGFSPHVLT